MLYIINNKSQKIMNSISNKKTQLQEPIPESAIVNKSYLEQLNQKELLFCEICLGLLNDPVMCASCQHTFCKSCINQWIERNNTCPTKCKEVSLVDIKPTLKKIMELLFIQCSCGKQISLLNYPTHKKECISIRCFNCGENVPLSNLRVVSQHYVEQNNNKVIGAPGPDCMPSLIRKIPNEVKQCVSFQLFIATSRYRGFITANKDYTNLYMTHCRDEALFFTVFFKDGKKYLKVYVPQKGWYFVEPHYDLGILIKGTKPSDSIDLDIYSGSIISTSGRTKGTPLAVRLTDFKLYFFNKSEIYQTCKAKCLFAVDDFGN